MTRSTNAVYQVEGSTAFSSSFAAGPWNPALQHGGAPSSLIAWVAERIETREPMRVVRITVDLLRPVPIAPLDIRTQVVREGRKIQVCSITLTSQGVEVVRASVLKIRNRAAILPETTTNESISLPGPQQCAVPEGAPGDSVGFTGGLELRVAKGAFHTPGPGAFWFRARRPIVAGQPISALMRATMAADFCNGISSVLDFRDWTFINADLSISLARMPVGEWILLDATTRLGESGAGIAVAKLGDESGYFGYAAQSLVIERRSD